VRWARGRQPPDGGNRPLLAGSRRRGEESDGGTADAQGRRKCFARRCQQRAPPRTIALLRQEDFMLGPLGSLPLNPCLLVALLSVPSRSPNSRPRAFGRTQAENTQVTRRAGTLAEDRDASRTGKDLAKSSRPRATGVRNQTHLLVVAASGPGG